MTYKLITETTPFLTALEETILNRLQIKKGPSEILVEKQHYRVWGVTFAEAVRKYGGGSS